MNTECGINYDNKKNGEVDFLVDDIDALQVLPIEVKSGKDYWIHTALDWFLANKDYDVNSAIVLSNEKEVFMFMEPSQSDSATEVAIC